MTDRPTIPPIGRDEFRAAMARIATAVSVITTDGPEGRHGMTASAVASVSDEPATILACIHRSTLMNSRLKSNGVMCVNVLSDRHDALSRLFANAGSTLDERFASSAWDMLATGAPVMQDAAIALDCEIVEVAEVATHSVFFGELRALRLAESASPLLYYNRGFHSIGTGILSED
ncbi:flavin reductase family protein [Altererythrobacter arenosus]|uniref:Flavin reductase family protein n=1 Tax=Altererythrobacter arenosus TaxID=3032592 RepID=A0ABY8FTC8_9SPHN|nr:flavin reductase family protein [Altererythrobacter sp. CAU 1644]WFL78268.1 flavin reductase family protein [Altererythrobacter sp. CAU 1644]